MRHPKRSIVRDIRTRRPLHPGRETDEIEALTWPEKAVVVRDCMSKAVVTAHPEVLARDAAVLMRARRIRHLPVIDRQGRLLGIVTDRDLRQVIFDPAVRARVGAVADALGRLALRDVMTWAVVTVRPGTEIREAARVMHEQKIGALPVVEADKLVGMLTETDVIQAFRTVLEEGGLAKPYRWAFAYR
jgi:acetoin utilization protein AcuB